MGESSEGGLVRLVVILLIVAVVVYILLTVSNSLYAANPLPVDFGVK